MRLQVFQLDSGIKLSDVGNLQTGKEYRLSQHPIPTPQSILDGSYLAALERSQLCPDVIVIVPRLPKHCGVPSLPSVVFSMNGRAGPYISDLIVNAVVDNAADLVFQDRIWKQTSLTIDVGHDNPHLHGVYSPNLPVAWSKYTSRVYSLCGQRKSGFNPLASRKDRRHPGARSHDDRTGRSTVCISPLLLPPCRPGADIQMFILEMGTSSYQQGHRFLEP